MTSSLAQAASLSTEGDEQEVPLIDVTPLSLGIQTAGGFMTSVLKRNTPLPAENTMVFSTHKDGLAWFRFASTFVLYGGVEETSFGFLADLY